MDVDGSVRGLGIKWILETCGRRAEASSMCREQNIFFRTGRNAYMKQTGTVVNFNRPIIRPPSEARHLPHAPGQPENLC